jgi:acyl carrier protein
MFKETLMDKPTFFAAVAEILEVDPSAFKGPEKIDDVGNWDSLSVISFVAMVDSDLGQIVDGEKLKNAKTFNDLAELVGL